MRFEKPQTPGETIRKRWHAVVSNVRSGLYGLSYSETDQKNKMKNDKNNQQRQGKSYRVIDEFVKMR